MNIIKLSIILVLSVITLYYLVRNSKKGISIAIFLFVLMPSELFFELGGNLPTITGFRAIILILIIYAFFINRSSKIYFNIPFINFLKILLIIKFISMVFSVDISTSLNLFIVFIFEVILFYVILVNEVYDNDVIDSILSKLALAAIIIAGIAFIEYYTGFNPVDYLVSSDHPRHHPRNINETYSTFPHPILFGSVLSMAWPICILMFDKQVFGFKKILMWFGMLVIFAGLYYSQSRGAWLGFILATTILLIYKYPRIKLRIIAISLLTFSLLLIRPGVFQSIKGLVSSTLDAGTAEGSSFYYRFELWKIAFNEISKSPLRFAFGYGDGSHHVLDIRTTMSYRAGTNFEWTEWRVWSWDSQLAIILLENGIIGIITTLLLYISIIVFLIKGISTCTPVNRYTLIALIASTSVYFFMMTNVAIFAPQLSFLLWSNVAIGVVLIKVIGFEESYEYETSEKVL